MNTTSVDDKGNIEHLLERILAQEVALQEAQIANDVLQRKLESCFYGAKQTLLRILGYVDQRSKEALMGKKIELSELERIVTIGAIALKNGKEQAERRNRDYEKSISADLAQLRDSYAVTLNDISLRQPII